MTKLRSGWNMPPGCFRTPGDEDDGPCDVCGKSIDDCICPECSVCSSHGDPVCYEKHGMVRTPEQLRAAEERVAADAAEEARWVKYAEEVESLHEKEDDQ